MKNTENHVAKDLLKHLLLFKELKAQHEEILRHKWLQSEKAGYDIGYTAAMIDWNLRHRSGWYRHRQTARYSLAVQI